MKSLKMAKLKEAIEDSDWENYWDDVETSSIEKLIQNYKSRWGYRKFASRVSAYWKKGHVLEVGAGLGYVSRILSKESKHRVFALDYNFNVCVHANRLAQKEGSSINFIQGDIQQLPFSDNSFEIIMSTGLLEHFDKKELLLMISEMRRTSSIIIANLPQKHLSWKLCWALRRCLGSRLDPNQRLYEKENMINLFQKAGFTSINIKTLKFCGIFPYMSLIAVK